MSDKTKKQFYFSDKPINLANITPLETEYPEITSSPEPKEITMSFDCEMPKETTEFFKKQMEELQEKENEILGRYRYVARLNARYYLPILKSLASDEVKEELLEDIILKTLCKGWNDCFEINVKHNKEVKL